MGKFSNLVEALTSAEALFEAWFEFRKGKKGRKDVQEFGRNLEKNIFRLRRDLRAKRYEHSPYSSFFIQDPKDRHIRKAIVRDRIVHQAVYTTLVRIFDPKLSHHIYSSRVGKGTHSAVFTLRRMSAKVSQNFTRPCWGLKCDIRKFYDSVDHEILLGLLRATILDTDAYSVFQKIIMSFHIEGSPGKGLPIGNLTSQIFTNIYLNEFDQFVKHTLKVSHYLRFADDCLFLSHKKSDLEELVPKLEKYLSDRLKLKLHPNKIILRPLHQGIDFLGYVTFPWHRVLRTTTRKRMLRKLSLRHREYFEGTITGESLNQSLQSYLGILSHADAYGLQQGIKTTFCWR